jgi:hypothetical protein
MTYELINQVIDDILTSVKPGSLRPPGAQLHVNKRGLLPL